MAALPSALCMARQAEQTHLADGQCTTLLLQMSFRQAD